MHNKKIHSSVLDVLPMNLRSVFFKINNTEKINEICLRTDLPVLLRCSDEFYYLTSDGEITKIRRSNVCLVNKNDVNEAFLKMCEYSVHSKLHEIQKGFLTLPGGHRAGVCGTAVSENGKVISIKDISSLNIRLSREVPGCASNIIREFYFSENRPQSLLIAGSPMSGKTTVLRDLCCQLSGDIINGCRIALIDEREELAGTFHGSAEYNMGVNVDILNGYPKAAGIQTAVRCFAPQIIICDEVSTREEANAVLEGMHSGVEFILTVHAFDREDLLKRPCVKTLLEAEVFKNIIILSGRDGNNAALFKKYTGSELLYESSGNPIRDNRFDICRTVGASAV